MLTAKLKSEKIANTIELLSKEDVDRRNTALAEGCKDEVCSACDTVFLAFHHFVRCSKNDCPMIHKEPDGSRGPSLLDMMLAKE